MCKDCVRYATDCHWVIQICTNMICNLSTKKVTPESHDIYYTQQCAQQQKTEA